MKIEEIQYFLACLCLNGPLVFLLPYYASFLRPKERNRKKIFVWTVFVLLLSIVWFVYARRWFPYAFPVFLYITYILYLRFCLKFGGRESILYTTLYYFLTQFIVNTAFWGWYRVTGFSAMKYPVPFLPTCVWGFCVGAAAYLCLRKVGQRLTYLAGYAISWREFLNILFLAAPLLYLCQAQDLMGVDSYAFPAEIVILRDVVSYCAVYAVIGILSMSKSGGEQAELARMEGLLASQYEQFKLKRESSERIMAKCHDLQKQLRLFEKTNRPEYLKMYEEELQKTIRDYDSLYETGNAIIDTLLSDAALKCREDGVQLICLLDGRSFDFIAPADLCTIFGNALDNAVESVRQIPEAEKRIIHVKSLAQKGFLALHFDNYYVHELRWEGGELKTSREEKEGHGYGLKSIRFAAEKYGGHMTSRAGEGKFVLTLAFPLPGAAKM